MNKSLPVLQDEPPQSVLRRDGRRNFVVPADVSGRFTRLKYALYAVLIGIYAALPWVQIGGHPAVQLDVEHRVFHLFGAAFNAQDFWMVFFILSGVGFALIVLTALFGRVWCGYACPQTVFLEGVFRRVERFIEGPRNTRLKRDKDKMSADKVLRKVAKHAAFLGLSVLVAHIFLSYFVSIPSLFAMFQAGPAKHPEAFAWATGMSGTMYLNFAWFREQLCLIICPYGRLQSALTDPDTLVIGYDVKRGEPRGKAKKEGVGDCVDCKRCVVVCPTGIDIRNGLQLDCIGCAACIDACDEVMTKLERPKGLIRYDSLNGLQGLPKRFLRPRVYLYAALGVLGLVVATSLLSRRVPFEANLLRLPGSSFTLEAEQREVRNGLELHVVNKRSDTATFEIKPVAGDDLRFVIAAPKVELKSLESRRVPVFATAPNDGAARTIQLDIDDGHEVKRVTAKFVAPR